MLLSVRDLTVDFGRRRRPALRGISFDLDAGERVGLIGESGSGKSVTALAIMGLLPENAHTTGAVTLAGHEVVGAPDRELSRLRGDVMSMVFQEPMTALDPTMKVGRQVAEVLLLHQGAREGASRARVVEMLAAVGLPHPERIADSYPHQLSGGQRQRVVSAIALANDPALLVCDEPTTALDVTVQAQVLDLVVTGVEERGAAMLFITHDLAVVATVCEEVAVMYGGRIVEAGPVEQVFRRPRHRYTQGLLAASDLATDPATGRLRTIRGSVPAAGRFPAGCVFRNRCWAATETCAVEPAWTGTPHGPGFACHHPASTPVIL